MKNTDPPRVLTISSPIGPLHLAATGKALVALVFRKADLKRLGFGAFETFETFEEGGTSPILHTVVRQLQEYFQGSRKGFEVPLDLPGTDFQRKVWDALRRIPFGETWSYGEVARRIGHPKAVRAVGTANGRNPVCILIPCHRVVRASGEAGGYAGGPEKKTLLLALEQRGLGGPGP